MQLLKDERIFILLYYLKIILVCLIVVGIWDLKPTLSILPQKVIHSEHEKLRL